MCYTLPTGGSGVRSGAAGSFLLRNGGSSVGHHAPLMMQNH